jgi:hypothetical protein
LTLGLPQCYIQRHAEGIVRPLGHDVAGSRVGRRPKRHQQAAAAALTPASNGFARSIRLLSSAGDQPSARNAAHVIGPTHGAVRDLPAQI